jgi:hypothetical protein
MRTKSFGRWIAALGFATAIMSICWATSGWTEAPGKPVSASVSTAPVKSPTVAARRLAPQFRTPFERVLQPALTQILNNARQNGTASRGKARISARQFDAAATSNGGNPNFPGFVAAPFYTIDSTATGDGSSINVSVTGDFNNDGKPDLVIGQVGGSITTFLNTGNFDDFSYATPLPPNNSLQAQVPYLTGLVAVDINGDGNLDLVGEDTGEYQIAVWLGHGDGTFGDVVTYPVQPKSGASWFQGGAMIVGDFNGDGHPDVAAITIGQDYSRPLKTTIVVQSYLNKGDSSGTLVVPTTESDTVFSDFYYSQPQQAALVTGDGDKPAGIAFLLFCFGSNTAAKQGESVLYIASNGDGTFTTPVEPQAGAIPVTNYDQGNGSFFATNLSTPISSASKRSGKAAPNASAGVATTDIVFANGDGAVYDIPFKPGAVSAVLPAPKILAGANANDPATLSSFAETSSKAFAKSSVTTQNATLPETGSPIPNLNTLNLADMNGDGNLDLIVYTAGSTLIYPGAGDGTFGLPAQVVGGTGGDQQSQPADFDGSGYNSFLWTDAYLNHMGYYRNLGSWNSANAGQFYAAPTVAGQAGDHNILGGNLLVQATGDFNGDGLLDVIAYDLTNVDATGLPNVVLGINNGHANTGNQTSNFSFTTIIPGATLYSENAAFIEPVTFHSGSGTSFLLVTGTGVLLYTGDANGDFGPPVSLNLGVHTDCTLNYADTGDINGDGAPDIVIPYGGDASCQGLGSTPSGYFTLLGTGSGTYQPATFTPLGGSLYMLKLINFGGAPGNLDLAADDLDKVDGIYSVYALPNNADGSGTFNTNAVSENANGYIVSDIIPGDFNNDGFQDLTLTTEGQLVAGSFSTVPDTTGILLLPSIGTQEFFNFGPPNLVDGGFYALWGSYADFNGDGYLDLAVATVDDSYGIAHPLLPPPDVPLVQILPNQHGSFGPVLTELDSAQDVQSTYLFTGNFGNTGGADLLVTSNANTAEFLNQGANMLTLTASAVTPAQGSAVTLTATVSQAASGYAPVGSVTFSDNGTAIGAAPLSGNAATLTTTSLAVGQNEVTAAYSGDDHHNASAGALTISVAPLTPMFTLTSSASTLSLSQGATGTVTLSIASNSTFAGAVSFGCSGAPTESSCTVNPASVTLGPSQSTSVSVIVATTPRNSQYQAGNHPMGKIAGGLSLAGLILIIVPRRRRLYSTLGILAFALLSFASMAALSGCGSGNRYPGTPVGNSTVTVTATSGSITQTQTIVLTVTKAQQ